MCHCRSFIEDSHAMIKISPQDGNFIGLNDRLVTIRGSLEECMHAIDLIMSRLIEDAHYSLSAVSPYPYSGVCHCFIYLLLLSYF